MAETLTFTPKDKLELYRAYMPFVSGGGIFINSQIEFDLHDEVEVDLTLPNNKQFKFASKIIWIKPKKLLSEDSEIGVGVQIAGKQAVEIQESILELIDNLLKTEQPTDTV